MEHLKLAKQWLKGEQSEAPHGLDGKALRETGIDRLQNNRI
jgi:hypothetical protein